MSYHSIISWVAQNEMNSANLFTCVCEFNGIRNLYNMNHTHTHINNGIVFHYQVSFSIYKNRMDIVDDNESMYKKCFRNFFHPKYLWYTFPILKKTATTSQVYFSSSIEKDFVIMFWKCSITIRESIDQSLKWNQTGISKIKFNWEKICFCPVFFVFFSESKKWKIKKNWNFEQNPEFSFVVVVLNYFDTSNETNQHF